MEYVPLEVQMNAERLWDDGGYKAGPQIIAEAIMLERQRCIDIASARMPLYDLAQKNAVKEIISSMKG